MASVRLGLGFRAVVPNILFIAGSRTTVDGGVAHQKCGYNEAQGNVGVRRISGSTRQFG